MQINITVRSVGLSESVKQMLVKLRSNHIDSIPYIQEELNQILPSLIEDTITNIYQAKMAEEK